MGGSEAAVRGLSEERELCGGSDEINGHAHPFFAPLVEVSGNLLNSLADELMLFVW